MTGFWRKRFDSFQSHLPMWLNQDEMFGSSDGMANSVHWIGINFEDYVPTEEFMENVTKMASEQLEEPVIVTGDVASLRYISCLRPGTSPKTPPAGRIAGFGSR